MPARRPPPQCRPARQRETVWRLPPGELLDALLDQLAIGGAGGAAQVAAQVLHRLAGVACLQVSQPQTTLRDRVVRVELERFLEGGDGLVDAALEQLGVAPGLGLAG